MRVRHLAIALFAERAQELQQLPYGLIDALAFGEILGGGDLLLPRGQQHLEAITPHQKRVCFSHAATQLKSIH